MVKLFCLVVGVEGAAFSIDIDLSKSVDNVKKAIAVQERYDFAPSKLQLFLARNDNNTWLASSQEDVKKVKKGESTALIKRLTAKEHLLEEELDLVEVLGCMPTPKSKEIHVLVVAPKQNDAKAVMLEGIFSLCNDPFYSYFSTIEEVGNWLKFPSFVPKTGREQFYVRDSYKLIAEKALSNTDPIGEAVLNLRTIGQKYVVVTGTPGIGKSVFMYYVLWKLIKAKKHVLFLTEEPVIYFDGTTIWDCTQLPKSVNWKFWSIDLWCLVDSADPLKTLNGNS
jgi:Crinkler effector protein N-terminal domain